MLRILLTDIECSPPPLYFGSTMLDTLICHGPKNNDKDPQSWPMFGRGLHRQELMWTLSREGNGALERS